MKRELARLGTDLWAKEAELPDRWKSSRIAQLLESTERAFSWLERYSSAHHTLEKRGLEKAGEFPVGGGEVNRHAS
jgi:hypothetical protein